MQCPRCGHDNSAEATICAACEANLQNANVSLNKPQEAPAGQPSPTGQPGPLPDPSAPNRGSTPQPGLPPQDSYVPPGVYSPPGGYPPGGYPPGSYPPQGGYLPPGSGAPINTNDPAIHSGSGSNAVLPAELKGLNWGSFFLTLFWSVANQVWWGLLILVPCIGGIMPFVLLFKGNEWAWQNRRWQSSQQFRDVQRTWGIWGVAITGLTFPFTLIMLSAILFPVFARGRENARRASCQSNLKQMSLAIMQYTQDYDEAFPLATVAGQGNSAGSTPVGWADALLPYLRSTKLFQCPSDKTPFSGNPSQSGYSDYVYNSSLSDPQVLQGHPVYEITPMVSEVYLLHDGSGSDPQSNATYSSPMGLTGDVRPPAVDLHLDGANFAYMDGHVKWLKKTSYGKNFAPGQTQGAAKGRWASNKSLSHRQ